MVNKFNWQGITSDHRDKIIDRVKETILAHHGYIIDFKLFSDLAMNLTIEVEENEVSNLYEAVSKVITLSGMEEIPLDSTSDKDWTIYLYISFSKGTGKLKTNVPAVPG